MFCLKRGMFFGGEKSCISLPYMTCRRGRPTKKVVTPKKVGGVYVYDATDGSGQDYDVPPPHNRSSPSPAPSSLPPGMQEYDNPPSIRAGVDGEEDPISGVYDAPKPGSGSGMDTYDIPRSHLVIKGLEPATSNRSSTVSMLSTGSSALSGTQSSKRSSLDTSGQDYDYPPAPKVVSPMYGGNISRNSTQSNEEDIYDTPPKARMLGDPDALKLPAKENSYSEISKLGQKEPSYQEITDLPMKSDRLKYSSSQFDAGDYIDDYAIPRSERSSGDSGIITYKTDPGTSPKFSLDMTATAKDIYDVPPGQMIPPKDSSPVKQDSSVRLTETEVDIAFQRLQVSDTGAVYDVPPQVTKDIPSPATDSSQGDHRSLGMSSGGRMSWDAETADPQPYEPLQLEVETALDTLAERQQQVHGCATKVLSFVVKFWRKYERMDCNKLLIKQSCENVKSSLEKYLNFGQGTLSSAKNFLPPERRNIANEIDECLSPLLEAQEQLKVHLKRLDEHEWSTEKLSSDNEADREQDDLDHVVTVTRDIPRHARSLTLKIQEHAKLLFKVVTSPSHMAKPGFGPSPVECPAGAGKPFPVDSPPQLLPTKQHCGPRPTPATPPQGRSASLEDILSAGSRVAKPSPPPLRPKPKLSGAERSASMKDRPLPVPPSGMTTEQRVEEPVSEPLYNVPRSKESVYNEIPEKPTLEHYDYVHLTKDSRKGSQESVKSDGTDYTMTLGHDSVDSSKRFSSSDLLDAPQVKASGLSPKFQERLQRLQKDSEKQVQIHTASSSYDLPNVHVAGRTLHRGQLHENDQMILDFYASQVDTHIEVLLNAIDAFMKCVDYNQPPKIFIAHSKFVILAAHKLVYIGDTISRNLLSEDLRNQLMLRGNQLCDALKATVVGTKNAALNYPSISVTQEMVDRVVDVSHAANDLKQIITVASASNS